MTIKVLIVDDSAVTRRVLSSAFDADAEVEVIGAASDPIFAMDHMKRQWPDVIVLDVEMPRMDGITFLRKIMAERPTPVVICSSYTAAGASITLDALSAGAVAIVTKPQSGLKQFLEMEAPEIVRIVKEAAVARLGGIVKRSTAPAFNDKVDHTESTFTTEPIVVLGASTGGTAALEHVLTRLPTSTPAVAIVQHMPERFTAAFAERLDSICQVRVTEACDGQQLRVGEVLVAPGGKHMTVERSGSRYCVRVIAGERINRHIPSVVVFFESVAKHVGPNAMGVIMTGMGDDGARGLGLMRSAGAHTIGQNEATCVVYGMPQAARLAGAVEYEVALEQIPSAIVNFGQRS